MTLRYILVAMYGLSKENKFRYKFLLKIYSSIRKNCPNQSLGRGDILDLKLTLLSFFL